MLQAFIFMLPLFVVSTTSTLLTVRFVKRYEVPRGVLRLGLLAPGLASVGVVFFVDAQMRWVFVLSGVGGTVLGLAGLGVLLYATRLTGLQPRVTPIDLSTKTVDSSF